MKEQQDYIRDIAEMRSMMEAPDGTRRSSAVDSRQVSKASGWFPCSAPHKLSRRMRASSDSETLTGMALTLELSGRCRSA